MAQCFISLSRACPLPIVYCSTSRDICADDGALDTLALCTLQRDSCVLDDIEHEILYEEVGSRFSYVLLVVRPGMSVPTVGQHQRTGIKKQRKIPASPFLGILFFGARHYCRRCHKCVYVKLTN